MNVVSGEISYWRWFRLMFLDVDQYFVKTEFIVINQFAQLHHSTETHLWHLNNIKMEMWIFLRFLFP